jgi:hypothetical protein
MNEDNKKRIIWGLKVLALGLYCLLTIAVCAGVWNCCDEKEVCFGAIVLLIANGLLAWRYPRRIGQDRKAAKKAAAEKKPEKE